MTIRAARTPASIRAAILRGAPRAVEIGDRAEAIRGAVADLQRGDVLLIAGKGHETGQIVGDEDDAVQRPRGGRGAAAAAAAAPRRMRLADGPEADR